MTDAHVLVSAEGAAGHIRLNRPEALNSLSHEMVGLIGAGIDRHLADAAVKTLVLTGAGDRALCAGGDIKMIWARGREAPEEPMAFWADEYRLNARIHRLPKPWVALMDGICMGGGVGLSVHGSHRVATERTRFAMPETGIGYFPDVGGTFALARAPGNMGLWLGLTGATVGAADAIAAGLADAMVPSAALPALVADLAAGANPDAAIAARAADPGPSALAENAALIESAFAAPDMAGILAALDADGSDFARATLDHLSRKSPSSMVLTLHLIREGAGSADLETCLQREYSADALILTRDDFYEGIRAAVIDRDRNPRWNPARIEDVDAAALIGGLRPQPPLFGRDPA